MISQCPHCSQPLKFSQPQMDKFKQALARLPQGRALKFGCPKCRNPIEINREGRLFEKSSGMPPGDTPGTPPADSPGGGSQAREPALAPPAPPDIGWLSSGTQEGEQVLEDVPTAMVLIDDPAVMDQVSAVLEQQKLQIHCPGTVDEAVAGQRFKTYDVVVYSTGYEQGPLEVHDFHKFMSAMAMNRRRHIFYVLVGKEVDTLYDLQALTLSANLVVNTREMSHFDKIFQKGMKGYEALFGPYTAMLSKHGKS